MIPATAIDLSVADEACVALQDIYLADETLKAWHKGRVYRVEFVTEEIVKAFPPPVIFVYVQSESTSYMNQCADLSVTLGVTFVHAVPKHRLLPEQPSLSGVVTAAKVMQRAHGQLRVSRYDNERRADSFTFQPIDYQDPIEVDGTVMSTHTFLTDYTYTGLPAATLQPA